MGRHIDIDNLSEDQLVELNHRIIERLKLLSRTRSTRQMGKFNVGDRVWFEGREGEKIPGIITRLNIKTATVMTETHRWNIHPRLLHKVEEMDKSSSVHDFSKQLKLIEGEK